MQNTSIRFKEDLLEKIDKIAKNIDRDRSYIINKAVESYIAQQEMILAEINAGLKDIDVNNLLNEKEGLDFINNLIKK